MAEGMAAHANRSWKHNPRVAVIILRSPMHQGGAAIGGWGGPGSHRKRHKKASAGRKPAERCGGSGSVWESNPLRALFKPSTGFEDQGPHQRCKHSRSPEALRKPQDFRDFLILP